jgi:molybdopterin-guanine dinucleotide biosynthesis protein A
MYRHDGGIEPLCAVYQPAALEPLAAAFDAGERSPSRATARLRVAFVGADDETVAALASVNTPDELRRATLDLTSTQATATDA